MRATIGEAFGAPVVDTFGSTEGLVGTTAPGESVLAFNSDMCIVELVDTPAVLDYQVRQTPRGIDVDLVTAEPPELGDVVDRLTAALTHAGLARPEVTARTVTTLTRHPDTGKAQRFVPLTTPEAGRPPHDGEPARGRQGATWSR